MANTYTLIASLTIGSGGAASIDLTSIPSTYTDLLLKVSARGSHSAGHIGLTIKLNNSSTSFSAKGLEGNGSAASSFNETTYIGNANGSTATANTFSNNELYFPNYANSNYKGFSIDSVQENNQTVAYQTLMSSLWSNTAAINQITLTPYSGTLLQYTTAYLYGIKNS
jgi:hypothetical protein